MDLSYRNTDNGDTFPTNRPFHVCRRLSGWRSISEFFERVEFKNFGAVDLHIAFWTEATIEELITSNKTHSTIPNVHYHFIGAKIFIQFYVARSTIY